MALAALLFSPSIALVQVPIQRALSDFWVSVIGVEAIRANLLAVGLPSALVSGLVQETTKLAVAVLGFRLLLRAGDRDAGLSFGAASGAGYGGFEAFWVFNTIFGWGFSLATVQLAGPAALLGFFERSATVPFHIGAAALSTYGYVIGRPWRYLAAAVLLHSMVNWSVLLLQTQLVGALALEVLIAAVGGVTVGVALWLRYRPNQGGRSLSSEGT